MSHQEALTIVAEVDPGHRASLDEALRVLASDPVANDLLPFGRLPGCHFGRVIVLPETLDLSGRPLAPRLLLLSDCDGSAGDHVQALVRVAGQGLDRLFGACAGYPAQPTPDSRLDFLRRKMIRVDANYVRRQGRTVEQIRREAELRQALRAFLDEHRFEGLPATEVKKRLVTFVKSDASLSWALDAPSGVSPKYELSRLARDGAALLGVVAIGPLLVPASLFALIMVRLAERRDSSDHLRPSPEHVRALAALEDFAAHNGFTAGGLVKPGLLRQLVIRSVLPLIGWGARNIFRNDSLAGVKTIHFARWIPIDDYRRVVFCSNYDGSLESYNNDFIDLVAWGLNLVFSNGFGYPKTEWLVFGGASLEQDFKDFLRRHQIPTPIWFSAYPDLTAVNVERNAALRAGLVSNMNERETQAWLRVL